MLRRFIAAACFAMLALSSIAPAQAQRAKVVTSCGSVTFDPAGADALTQDTTGKLCTAASVSASISGFTPNGNFATLTASASSGSVALPAGATVAFQNTGTTTVSCTLGVGSATATASQIQVPASSTVFVTVGSNTFGACIDQSGSASNLVVLAGGSGLGTGFGGGGGGSSGAVFGPTAVGSAAANPPVLQGGTANGTATGAVNVAKVDTSGTQFIDCSAAGNTLCGFLNSATPAGENHIGEIASNQIKVQVAPATTIATYATGKAVGTLMTVANAARVSGALGAAGTGGILTGLTATSKVAQSAQMDIFLFDASPAGSTCTDNTLFVLGTADIDKLIGVVTIPGTQANGAGWFGAATPIATTGVATYYPVTYDLSSATSIFACAVTRGTPAFTGTADISFKFNILRN